jgi:preprotein translocase SecE subunit
VARDRQRSKARQRARAAQEKGGKPPRSRARKDAPDETGLDDANVEETGLGDAAVEESGIPGILPERPTLDHSTGMADEIELAEAGVPIPGPNDETPEEMSDEDFAALEDEVDEFEREMEHAPDELEVPADLATESRRGRHAPEDGEFQRPRKERGKVITFLRGCIEELRRVQWPDRQHVFSATAVVLGFCLVAGLFLGAMDAIWKPLINAIL